MLHDAIKERRNAFKTLGGRLVKVTLPPPIINEPILFFKVDPAEVASFEICGMNSTDIGVIQGAAMREQKRYRIPEGDCFPIPLLHEVREEILKVGLIIS
jgi:hypothetical protein